MPIQPSVNVDETRKCAPNAITADANPQSNSLLFTLLPPEIRAEIFALALSTSRRGSGGSGLFWSWPPIRRTFTSILETCKRVYDEASPLVWKEGSGNEKESFFWADEEKRPPDYDCKRSRGFRKRFSLAMTTRRRLITHQQKEHGGSPTATDDGEEGWLIPARVSSTTLSKIHLFMRSIEAEDDDREWHFQEFSRISLADVAEMERDSPFQTERQRKFTAKHWSKITTIHILAEHNTFCRRAFLRTFVQAKCLRPRIVKVTLPFNPAARNFVEQYVPQLEEYYFPESVEQLVLILQVHPARSDELEAVVEQVVDEKKSWRWKRVDDEYLDLDTVSATIERDPKPFDKQKLTPIIKVLTFTAQTTRDEWDGLPFDRALARQEYNARLKHISFW
jgi:hypothetical protein